MTSSTTELPTSGSVVSCEEDEVFRLRSEQIEEVDSGPLVMTSIVRGCGRTDA
ncbi:hypothetical protein [Streptomyces sp. NPDC050164]|uniref:hypothetical protein n=1 Tax=Streptomyces sp. NPDC050164 TaxID=3365605 RepID=UPI00378D325A